MRPVKDIAIVGALQAVVREIFAAILLATGVAPIIMGAIAAFGTLLAAIFEGRTALDVAVYGIATFASITFLTWLAIQIVSGLRGKPMTLATRDRLTLGEIANRWAKETENHPGAISREEIFKELPRGDFLIEYC